MQISEKVEEYRKKALEALEKVKLTPEANQSRMGGVDGFAVELNISKMLRNANTAEDFQVCLETLDAVRTVAEENNLDRLKTFCIESDMEFLKKHSVAKYPNAKSKTNPNTQEMLDTAKKIINDRGYGLVVLDYQLSLSMKYDAFKVEEQWTDAVIGSLINGCRTEGDFQELIERYKGN